MYSQIRADILRGNHIIQLLKLFTDNYTIFLAHRDRAVGNICRLLKKLKTPTHNLRPTKYNNFHQSESKKIGD